MDDILDFEEVMKKQIMAGHWPFPWEPLTTITTGDTPRDCINELACRNGWPVPSAFDGAFEPPANGWRYEANLDGKVLICEGSYEPDGTAALRWFRKTNKKW